MPPKKVGGKAAGGGGAAAAATPPSTTPTLGAAVAAPILTWNGELHAQNTIPGRCSAVAVVEDQKLLLIGGWAGNRTSTTASTAPSIYQLDLSAPAWSELDATGEPHAGYSQAAAADVGGALLFFGGWTGLQRTNDTTLFQLDQKAWVPFATVGERPPPLTFPTMNLIGKRVYIYGGNHNDGQSGDVHVLDLQSTAWGIAANSGAPPKRSSHTATVVHDTMLVVFGGRGDSGCLNDVAIFDASTSHWQINIKFADGSASPSTRSGHSAAAVGPNVAVFGGCADNGQLLNDLWLLRAEKSTAAGGAMLWQRIETEGPPPSVRCSHSAIDNLSSMYIVGGRTDAFGDVSSQVYVLDTSAVAPLAALADGAADDARDGDATAASSRPPLTKASTTPGATDATS